MEETLDDFVAQHVLPKGILGYFKYINTQEHPDELHVNLEEMNTVPVEHTGKRLKSKGFYQTKHIQDFPLRGKPVILRVKQRRWIDKDTGEYVTRNWDLVATGTKLTPEFADFLKELDRE